MNTGRLYLISAPSGAGKTSMVSALSKQDDLIKLSISHTTRKPRINETNGKHYYFVSDAEFEELIINEQFLEYANVYGNLYGTTKKSVNNMLCAGFDVILEIDWQGAKQVEKIMPEAISICIAPPSIQTLRNRLEARGTDDKEVIERRMTQANEELSHLSDSQYIIINDNFSDAVIALQAIFIAQRHLYKYQHSELLKNQLI